MDVFSVRTYLASSPTCEERCYSSVVLRGLRLGTWAGALHAGWLSSLHGSYVGVLTIGLALRRSITDVQAVCSQPSLSRRCRFQLQLVLRF